MIIDTDHPDSGKIFCYDIAGRVMRFVFKVNTDTMIAYQYKKGSDGKIFITADGKTRFERTNVYKIVGPNIYYTRKRNVRVLNTKK